MATQEKYVIVGGGGFGREVACWILDVIAREGGALAGFVDDQPKDLELFPRDVPYLGTVAEFKPQTGHALLMAIGNPKAKREVAELLRNRSGKFVTMRHPTAVIAATAKLGEGGVYCPYSVVSANAAVGEFVTVNIASSVGHDVRVGAFTTLAAHVDLTGGVEIGEAVNVGSGARVLPGVRVGSDATVGAGAIVMRTVAPNTTVYAAAAKRL